MCIGFGKIRLYFIVLTAMTAFLWGCSMNKTTDNPVATASAFYLSHDEEIDLIEKASKNDNEASFKLYQFSSFVKLNKLEAMRWLKKSAQDGNILGQCVLGVIYLDDPEFKNIEEGKHWLRIAAANGCEKAKEKLIDFKE